MKTSNDLLDIIVVIFCAVIYSVIALAIFGLPLIEGILTLIKKFRDRRKE